MNSNGLKPARAGPRTGETRPRWRLCTTVPIDLNNPKRGYMLPDLLVNISIHALPEHAERYA